MNQHSTIIQLGDLMVERGGSTDPSKHADTAFALYSIPAFDAGTPEFVLGAAIGSSKKNVEPSDVLRIVPHIRRAWVVAEHDEPIIASSEWIVFRDGRIHPNYLRHFLASDLFHSQFMMTVAGVGGSLLRARPADVARISLHLPSLPEQRRIAAILDKADALRRKRRQAIELLDSLTQSIFLEMFGDPVSNPNRYARFQIADIAMTRLGKMLDTAKQASLPKYGYLANTNVQWGRFELSDLRQMGFSAEDRVEFSLRDGDLLICEGGEIGRCAIWRGELRDCYFQKALHRLRCDINRVVPEYMEFYFRQMVKNGGLTAFTTVATIPHLTGVKLRRLEVPVPPIADQQRFVRIYRATEHQLGKLHQDFRFSEILFSSLQSRAFSGQL